QRPAAADKHGRTLWTAQRGGVIVKRARMYLYGLGAAAVMLMLGFSPVVQAGASSNENTILELESIVDVSGQCVVPTCAAVRGPRGCCLAWVITSGQGEVDCAGSVDVEVRGLVLANTPPVPLNLRLTNSVPNCRAVVSCLDASGNPVNVSTGLFPASPQGNADIEATVQLPRPCRAPIVFVTSPALAWFAMSVKQAED